MLKKFSNASSLLMPIRSASTISHQMLSPILCSKSTSFESSTGQRPCCAIVRRPTKPASVKNANASSSTDHSLKNLHFSKQLHQMNIASKIKQLITVIDIFTLQFVKDIFRKTLQSVYGSQFYERYHSSFLY